MTNEITLGWGQAQVLPDGATAAWGARLIVGQDGHVDFLSDRTDANGDKQALFPLLNQRCGLAEVKNTISDLLYNGWMQTREGEDFILYLDDQVAIHANTNGSAGYCYVTAWLGF